MQTDARPKTDIVGVLLGLHAGDAVNQINDRFNEVVTGVLETGKDGELTIKLKLHPSKFGMGEQVLEVETSYECRVKMPQGDIDPGVFVVTKRGTLSCGDEDQEPLFTDAEAVKTVAA
jgi:hypothetical protein